MKRAAFLKRMAFAWAATMLPEIRTPEVWQMPTAPVTTLGVDDVMDVTYTASADVTVVGALLYDPTGDGEVVAVWQDYADGR